MGNSVHWNGHVFCWEDGQILRALEFECERKNGKLKKRWMMKAELLCHLLVLVNFFHLYIIETALALEQIPVALQK